MSANDKILCKALKSVLNEKLSQTEAQALRDEGFSLKNPTRKATVMIALYKKAQAGDLAAIKEIRSIVSEDRAAPQKPGEAVIIIDDTGV